MVRPPLYYYYYYGSSTHPNHLGPTLPNWKIPNEGIVHFCKVPQSSLLRVRNSFEFVAFGRVPLKSSKSPQMLLLLYETIFLFNFCDVAKNDDHL